LEMTLIIPFFKTHCRKGNAITSLRDGMIIDLLDRRNQYRTDVEVKIFKTNTHIITTTTIINNKLSRLCSKKIYLQANPCHILKLKQKHITLLSNDS
jgi:hypothetical protein